MGESSAETYSEILATRERMSATLDELGGRVRKAADWKAQVRARPWLFAGLALAAGFLVAGGPRRAARAIIRRGEPKQNAEQLRLAKEAEDRQQRLLKEAARATLLQRMAMRSAEVAGTALAGMVAKKVADEVLKRHPQSS